MSVRSRTLLLCGAFVASWLGGYLAAELRPPSPIVEVRPIPEATPRTPRGGRLAPVTVTVAAPGGAVTATAAATGTDPAAPPSNGGGGGAGRASGCVTDPPGPSFTCQNGVWIMTTSTGAPSGAAPQPTPSSPSTLSTTPGSNTSPSSNPGTPGTSPSPTSSGSGGLPCTPPSPGEGYRCDNGVWVRIL